MPAPSQEHGVVRLKRQPTREGGDRLPELPRPRLRHTERNQPLHGARLVEDSSRRAGDRTGIVLRAIGDAGRRGVLHRLPTSRSGDRQRDQQRSDTQARGTAWAKEHGNRGQRRTHR